MAEPKEGMEDFIDDEVEIDDGAHEKLLNSIFALDGKKRFKNVVRGLPGASSNMDFAVHARSQKIKREDLKLKTKHFQTQLKKPLTGLETEKAQRQIARETMVTEVSKWEPVVQEIRAAPQTIFSKRPYGIKMYEAVQPKQFIPRTPLEKEIYEALGKSEDILRPDQEMTVAETKAIKAMSVKEAKERRAELLKHHELLSRVELKAKWQNKIKSKRYRKIIRKEKVMADKKQLEQLQKSDPEAFLEKLDQIERARMEERLTLKHRGGGKFSRMHKAYSKFDDKTRDAVQDMLQKSRELTKKQQTVSSSEDEIDNNPDMGIKEANGQQSKDGKNESDDDDESDETKKANFRARQLEILKAVNRKAGGWLDVPKTFTYTPLETRVDAGDSVPNAEVNHSENDAVMDVDGEANTIRQIHSHLGVGQETKIGVVQNPGISEDPIRKSLKTSRRTSNIILKNTAGNSSEIENISECLPEQTHRHPEGSDLKESEMNRTGELTASSVEQNTSESQQAHEVKKKKRRRKNKNKTQKTEDSVNISTVAVHKEKPVIEINLQTVSDKTDELSDEENDDEEMKVTMEELFQDEDVVEEFAKEKAQAEERSRPKFEDTKLPGWGNWAGPDYKNSKQNERNKKKAIGRARRLQREQSKIRQPNVWLNPGRNEAIRKLQPKTVPFPYTSVQQYEASLRQPMSRGFVRETAFKLLTKPEVVTKLGHIIKPLDKEDYFKKKEIADFEETNGKTDENKGNKRRRSVR